METNYNEICCQQVRVCGYRQDGRNVMQDNWLFTQYISKNSFTEKSTTIFITLHIELALSVGIVAWAVIGNLNSTIILLTRSKVGEHTVTSADTLFSQLFLLEILSLTLSLRNMVSLYHRSSPDSTLHFEIMALVCQFLGSQFIATMVCTSCDYLV